MYELNNKIRLIDVMEYGIENTDEFVGFIRGIVSVSYTHIHRGRRIRRQL